MNKLGFTVALLALVGLAGCIPSLHSIYTDRDVGFESSLLGVWAEKPESKVRWHFSQAEGKAYRLVYTEDTGKTGSFVVHLVNLSGTLFLDLYPEEPNLQDSDFYKLHFLPVHTFMLVDQITPTLRIAIMEPGWLRSYVREHPDAIRHEFIKGGDVVVLTASTKELQAFLVKHTKTDGAFGSLSNLHRMSQNSKTP